MGLMTLRALCISPYLDRLSNAASLALDCSHRLATARSNDGISDAALAPDTHTEFSTLPPSRVHRYAMRKQSGEARKRKGGKGPGAYTREPRVI